MKGINIGPFCHSLDREANGHPNPTVAVLEVEADLIAFELLAPSEHVAAATAPGRPRFEALRTRYGLPVEAAETWARWIDARRAPDPLVARLDNFRSEKLGGLSKSGLQPGTRGWTVPET